MPCVAASLVGVDRRCGATGSAHTATCAGCSAAPAAHRCSEVVRAQAGGAAKKQPQQHAQGWGASSDAPPSKKHVFCCIRCALMRFICCTQAATVRRAPAGLPATPCPRITPKARSANGAVSCHAPLNGAARLASSYQRFHPERTNSNSNGNTTADCASRRWHCLHLWNPTQGSNTTLQGCSNVHPSPEAAPHSPPHQQQQGRHSSSTGHLTECAPSVQRMYTHAHTHALSNSNLATATQLVSRRHARSQLASPSSGYAAAAATATATAATPRPATLLLAQPRAFSTHIVRKACSAARRCRLLQELPGLFIHEASIGRVWCGVVCVCVCVWSFCGGGGGARGADARTGWCVSARKATARLQRRPKRAPWHTPASAAAAPRRANHAAVVAAKRAARTTHARYTHLCHGPH
jgi:hypothetical protein